MAPGFTVGGASGVALGGDLVDGDHRWEFGVGGFGVVSASYTVLDGAGELPFLVAGLVVGASGAGTDDGAERATFVAIDARASLTIGKMFWRAFAPYAVLRLFGGPALWQRADTSFTGSDVHHYQLGAGMLVTGEVLGAVLEVVPLGERNVTLGATASF